MKYSEYRCNSRENIINIIFIIFLSLTVYKVLMQIHAMNFQSLSLAAQGVIEGKPHWISFQNRLLGPYIVLFISKIGLTYQFSLNIFILVMIISQNIILFLLLIKNYLSPKNALITVSFFSFTFLLMQHRWFYTWDNIDIIIFTLFSWGVLQSKSIKFFIALFFLELLNRESALFIALYVFIDSFYFESLNKFKIVSIKRLITGLSLIVFGILYTKFIRSYLFISQPDGALDTSHALMGNHFYLLTNIKDLFFDNLFSLNIINTAFIIGSVYYLIVVVKPHTDRTIKAVLIFIFMVACIVTISALNETRMYFILLPFLIFIPIHCAKNELPDRITADALPQRKNSSVHSDLVEMLRQVFSLLNTAIRVVLK